MIVGECEVQGTVGKTLCVRTLSHVWCVCVGVSVLPACEKLINVKLPI